MMMCVWSNGFIECTLIDRKCLHLPTKEHYDKLAAEIYLFVWSQCYKITWKSYFRKIKKQTIIIQCIFLYSPQLFPLNASFNKLLYFFVLHFDSSHITKRTHTQGMPQTQKSEVFAFCLNKTKSV